MSKPKLRNSKPYKCIKKSKKSNNTNYSKNLKKSKEIEYKRRVSECQTSLWIAQREFEQNGIPKTDNGVIFCNSKKPNHKISNGELKIVQFLNQRNIKYVKEKYFKNCINVNTGKLLFFDFYIAKLKICIEYDGKQHFECSKFFYPDKSESERLFILKRQKQRDAIKDNYCLVNKIKLIRIKYNDDIYAILSNIFVISN